MPGNMPHVPVVLVVEVALGAEVVVLLGAWCLPPDASNATPPRTTPAPTNRILGPLGKASFALCTPAAGPALSVGLLCLVTANAGAMEAASAVAMAIFPHLRCMTSPCQSNTRAELAPALRRGQS